MNNIKRFISLSRRQSIWWHMNNTAKKHNIPVDKQVKTEEK
ncbi:hypothetical protein OAA09_01195 [bacterium]|nr:hypothetical protein [bacterium]